MCHQVLNDSETGLRAQDKTNVPHFVGKPKAAEGMDLYQIGVAGAIVHGVGNFAYHYSKRFPHDSSMVANIILNVISRIKASKGRLPRKLYIQLDNCIRENKNKNMLGVLAVLILIGWLDHVRTLLTVGET